LYWELSASESPGFPVLQLEFQIFVQHLSTKVPVTEIAASSNSFLMFHQSILKIDYTLYIVDGPSFKAIN
jgi:hypothetical protein